MTRSKDVDLTLQRAKELGEVFLTRLSKTDLERTGFNTSPFGYFKFVDINLIFVDDEYFLEYVFDGDLTYAYHVKPQELGRELREIVQAYLNLRQTEAQKREPEKKITADMEIVESYHLGLSSVYVYRVTPHPTPAEFFVVTFNDRGKETVWGFGPNPEEALKDAIDNWEKEENPFQLIYNAVYGLDLR